MIRVLIPRSNYNANASRHESDRSPPAAGITLARLHCSFAWSPVHPWTRIVNATVFLFMYVLRNAAAIICCSIGLVTLLGCRPKTSTPAATAAKTPPLTTTEFAPRGTSKSTALFESIAPEQSGIDFVPQWQPRNAAEMLLLKTGFTGGGVCLGDFDNDGLADVYFTRSHGGGRLYRNRGDFRFEDVTRAARLEFPDDWTTGATACDINNDGWLDLTVCCHDSANRVFLNQQDGTFLDVAARGLDFAGASVKMIYADYDHDGDLDAYLVTNRLEPKTPTKIRYTGKPGAYDVAAEHQELAMVINLPSGEQKFAKAGQSDRLFRNQLVETGGLRFTDVTHQAGISGNFHGLDGCWWDADDDGDPDLYITNDFTDPDQFFRNNGDGTFTEMSQESLPCTPWFAMGCDAGDLNNDGLLDLMVADMAGTTHYREKIAMGSMDAVAWFLDTAEPRQYMRNSLYINTGTTRFVEAAFLAGLAKSDWTWSVKIADFDNDGREDVYFTNGFTRDYLNSDFNNRLRQQGKGQQSLAWYDAPRLEEQNLAFRNQGNLHFQNVSSSWGLDQQGISFGAAVGDLDNDGDLDLIVNNFEAAPSVYRNRSTQSAACEIRLVGATSNRQGLGAKVVATTSRGRMVRYHNPSGGFFSCDDAVLHFGTGDVAIDQIRVHWPSGITQTLTDIPTDKRLTIQEPHHPPTEPAREPTPQPWFQEIDHLARFQHQEQPYDDFQEQPLLPNKLSQLGPGLATGDVNGDGLLDVFLGGAAGQSGRLLVQTKSHRFVDAELPCLRQHAASEDMGCLLFDVDNDRDLDLFVVSGGVEAPRGDESYRDRLYLNESTATQVQFRHASKAIPDVRDSGGPAAAADFDGDGDLDLFVGGRVVPAEYPLPPNSRLFRNDGGRFIEVTESAVQNLGMVTSALWSDIDDDGNVDLLLTNDYGPIRVLRNEGGQLTDVSKSIGTAELLGWWNSVNGCDLDLDGDTDYIVGNLGHNTKYHPTDRTPQYLFYGRFEENGRSNIVEAKSGDAGLLPTRGRSCSSNAMPFISQKFDTYHGFASASLEEIYSDDALSRAHRVAVTETSTGVLWNDLSENGQRKLRFEELPMQAQLAPVFGIEAVFANDDVFPDLVLAQNFYTPQRETGRMAGGIGCLLLGHGDGRFEVVPAARSGIVLPDDAKSTAWCDWDNDGRIELIVGVNDKSPRVFRTAAAVSAVTPADCGIGQSLWRSLGDRRIKFERYCGSGYLNGSSHLAVPTN